MAVIIDEYGGVKGIVTHHDLLEAIAGEFPESDDAVLEYEIALQDDGSYIVDGKASMYDVQNQTGFVYQQKKNFATFAGFILHEFSRIPPLAKSWNGMGGRLKFSFWMVNVSARCFSPEYVRLRAFSVLLLFQ